jgi:hypothetical protein
MEAGRMTLPAAQQQFRDLDSLRSIVGSFARSQFEEQGRGAVVIETDSSNELTTVRYVPASKKLRRIVNRALHRCKHIKPKILARIKETLLLAPHVYDSETSLVLIWTKDIALHGWYVGKFAELPARVLHSLPLP